MNITVPREPLRIALTLAASVADRRSTVAAFTCVLIRADGKSVTVAASDLAQSYITTIECAVREPGAIALDARGLSDIVGSLVADEVSIRKTDGKGEIRGGKSRFQLGAQSPDDFPKMPDTSAMQFTPIDGQALLRMCDAVVFCASTDSTNSILSGVHLDLRDSVAMATDGHRAAIVRSSLGAKLDKAVHVPRAGIATMCKVIGDEKEVGISIGYDVLYLRVGATVLAVKLLEADFSSHAGIINACARPKSDHEVTAGRMALLDSVKRVALATTRDTHAMNLAVVKDIVSLKASSAAGISEDEIAVAYDGKGIEVTFNAAYLSEALETISGDEVMVGMSDGSTFDPIVLRPVAEEMGEEHIQIVMRMH